MSIPPGQPRAEGHRCSKALLGIPIPGGNLSLTLPSWLPHVTVHVHVEDIIASGWRLITWHATKATADVWLSFVP